jgi:carbamoyltransferase
MAYNILGIHPGHNGAAALVSDGKLVYYLEEERLSRSKRDGNPFRVIIDICSKYKVDELIIGGTGDKFEFSKLPYDEESPYFALVRKFYPNIKLTWANLNHHLLHGLCAYFNSSFPKAGILIIDGSGSTINSENSDKIGFECETIFSAQNNKFDTKYKNIGTNSITREVDKNFNIDNGTFITKTYEAVTKYLGWDAIEGGKTMGLAPYGKPNPLIPPLYLNGMGNRNLFYPVYASHAILDEKNNNIFQRKHDPKEWHTDPTKLTEIEADIAWKVQNESQISVADLVEKTIELSNSNNICIAGGYGLNCVTNYFIKKQFPKINFFHEPISHDGGTAIGAAYYGWINYSGNAPNFNSSTIYLGPKYSTNQYLTTLKNYNNKFNPHKTTPKQVAKLISERNIVTIFQGRSEAGPRALGNRSILYDPTDPNGKDFVNKVKKREWFRPFAGTVLLEKANEYFDMAGLKESPFMMYAMDVWPDKQEKIKAITHVDGTCRIQTVTEEQNPHYYKLIQEFEKITGVPILFNTSFNLAGDPLVETIEDALETILKSELKYLYLPELEMLLEKK